MCTRAAAQTHIQRVQRPVVFVNPLMVSLLVDKLEALPAMIPLLSAGLWLCWIFGMGALRSPS